MSTSLLYHAWGLHGYRYVRTRYERGTVIFAVEPEPLKLRCVCCGSRQVVRRGQRWRRFRTLPVGARRVVLEVKLQRLACRACGGIRQAAVPFAEVRRTYTKRLERYVVSLAQTMSLLDVARHVGLGWDTVKEIMTRHLRARFGRPKLRRLRRIAIDEIAIGRGHRYLTVVLDLESGAVVFVGDGKGGDALLPFWRQVRRARAKIEAVATDMAPAYIDAVRTYLPEGTIVFDHFHLVKLVNEKLAQLRRTLHREAEDLLQKQVLKGSRWLLMKHPEHLDARRNERQRLDEALALNQPLATAYYLKEDLRQLWKQPDKPTAARLLEDWIARAEVSGIRILQRLAKTVATYRQGILAVYDISISTGPLEAVNNKIKLLQRTAFGFRDHEFFKLRIMGLHEAKYALTG